MNAREGNTTPLADLVAGQHQGQAAGIASICSAHPQVIEAALRHALAHGRPALIESTCNQVNQYGGYTGMTARDFARFVREIAAQVGLQNRDFLLGGDHLGPNPWRKEPANTAMDKASVLVSSYVNSGYSKLHLDASMHLGDDTHSRRLPVEVVAARSAALAKVAEETFAGLGEKGVPPYYVIGTEVPAPGGIEEEEGPPAVTTPEAARETIQATKEAFSTLGLDSAWERVIALVVQPGVEYGNDSLFAYDERKAASLSSFVEDHPGLVFEAHSTDYQARLALRRLVVDHFAILKVGPALTFAWREALFALEMIEEAWLNGRSNVTLSNLRQVIEDVMLAKPGHWSAYYPGDEAAQRYARQYSLSDRIRYYWPDPDIQAAINVLLHNLDNRPIPLPLLSQYLPRQLENVRSGSLANAPHALLLDAVDRVLRDYTFACASQVGEVA